MTKVYLDEDLPAVKKHKEMIAVMSAEMIMHAREGRFDKKDFQMGKINDALSELRELHLKLDDEEMKVRGSMF